MGAKKKLIEVILGSFSMFMGVTGGFEVEMG
jgi:hypothetical protein